MWSQACDLLEQAERMHRQFFRLAASQREQVVWEPPADVFEDEEKVVVVVALPGVAPEHVDVSFVDGGVVVRAGRRIPRGSAPFVVRRLEIPYGCFERRIPLPCGRFNAGTPEFVDGCLMLALHKTDQQ
jgi:HSP20 family molecular chaperone IbpA